MQNSCVNDIILVGTSTNLLAYNVVNNSDIFYKDVPDGVFKIEFGPLKQNMDQEVCVVGGTCSIQAFELQTTVYFSFHVLYFSFFFSKQIKCCATNV